MGYLGKVIYRVFKVGILKKKKENIVFERFYCLLLKYIEKVVLGKIRILLCFLRFVIVFILILG